jgi:lipid-A-disaccharide synthase
MLAASGTVTLEMALARAPMVVCYKVGPIVGSIAKSLIDVPSVVLANLILEKKVFPELIQENCTPETISAALQPLMRGDEERKTQIDALAEIESKMQLPNQMTPSQAAAQVVLAYGNNDKLAAA